MPRLELILLGLCGRPFEALDLDLPHAQHRLHDALRLLAVGVSQKLV
jgi:hypothetical protein